MNDPYREPGVRPGRLIHQSVRFLVTRQEWEDLQAAAQRDDVSDVGEWVYQTVLKALRERKD